MVSTAILLCSKLDEPEFDLEFDLVLLGVLGGSVNEWTNEGYGVQRAGRK